MQCLPDFEYTHVLLTEILGIDVPPELSSA